MTESATPRTRASADGVPPSGKIPGESKASAWDAALRLLGVRARSRDEMRKRLERRGFEAAEVESVMTRLDSAGLLDDAEFASEWVRSRHANSGKGRIALRHELVAKGIDKAVVEDALADVDPDAEREIAAALVSKKLTPSLIEQAQVDRAGREKAFRRLVGMLVRRGYSQSMSIDVVNDALRTG
ncbi:regulatory protein RecX [Gordonia effusa NBRC 100432]|uniref:Regulatory protein RecX n=1 Tax=Gordonia effusa NBRC 100432 TaxID=1077974 RepID=H0R270_9ACTN|nr:regulatory protein RecX [Gordonia effusa]GAB19084.1 regulatory protein RecX [Gordonia effusa NBRC 100432]